MPKDSNIKKVLVIGSGPIVIGQACEFDYSGTQACKVLREEGVKIVLINPNPATIMTDPEMADATYIEPITSYFLEKIIEKEKPDAVLATLGGQTALNAAIALHKEGVLEKHGVRLIGANVDAINRGENREVFRDIVDKVGGESARSIICHSLEECYSAVESLNYPVVIRPSFTMGGLGSGIAYKKEELTLIAGAGLHHSPTTEVLLEESIIGWKEYELEVMRDKVDNVVIVCSIENIDPMGVHTGDSITVAPALTLTDVELQKLRDLSIKIIREVGVDTGGCNIQFAVDPKTGRIVVIEMNPRVSRSSALASKATGYPIAKVATRLALGYTLDEIKNDITKNTPASFEPTLDYIVVKCPRFAFDKFPDADNRLTTTMKSVGESMAIGRNFTEALQKSMRSLEKKNSCFHWRKINDSIDELKNRLTIQTENRIVDIQQALRLGISKEEVNKITGFDPWILEQISLINSIADELAATNLTVSVITKAKRHGFSDKQISELKGIDEDKVRKIRHSLGVRPIFKTVDTCAAEFEAFTPYYYSSYDEETEIAPRSKPAVIILGSGPNRIGQGIEFDYSCVHAAKTLSADGYETIMINCNPETVSTDYDTSDRLYFEPLTLEDVLEVIEAEKKAGPLLGVIVSIGGQTPLKLAHGLEQNGVQILGTQPRAIELAEDRKLFGEILKKNGILAPVFGMADNYEEALLVAKEITYPVLVRPSFVLGGQGMKIVYDDESLKTYIKKATDITPDRPVLIDKFLDSAIELDIDALFDGEELYFAGVMEHVELAGVHSGDSACSIPPRTMSEDIIREVERISLIIAKEVGVVGLINLQMAIKDNIVYVLEANPRASRTVPFVSKATNVPLAKLAAQIALGKKMSEIKDFSSMKRGKSNFFATKEVVLPWNRFRKIDGINIDSLLGPEMKSTGEVMGIARTFAESFAKSQIAAFGKLTTSGLMYVDLSPNDKNQKTIDLLTRFKKNGFRVCCLAETSKFLEPIIKTVLLDLQEVLEMIDAGDIGFSINTSENKNGRLVRASTIARKIPQVTTLAAAEATEKSIEFLRRNAEFSVESLQDLS